MEKHAYQGWRYVIYNFSPSWFGVTMGTGIVSIIVVAIPFSATWLFYASLAWFILNTILFVTFLAMTIVRYTLWPETWTATIQSPADSLFLGAIMVAFSTVIEMLILAIHNHTSWGEWVVYLASGLWMVDSVLSVSVTLLLCHLLATSSKARSLEHINPAQLLPIAASTVAAGTGAEIAGALKDPRHALGTLIASLVLWSIAIPLACTTLVIYYQRLAFHKTPAKELIVSTFMPMAPLSFGGFGIMLMGRTARDIFPATGTLSQEAGEIFYVVGWLIGLLMWSWALLWLSLALGALWVCRPFPFNLSSWGCTFPLGVVSLVQV